MGAFMGHNIGPCHAAFGYANWNRDWITPSRDVPSSI